MTDDEKASRLREVVSKLRLNRKAIMQVIDDNFDQEYLYDINDLLYPIIDLLLVVENMVGRINSNYIEE